MKQKSNDGKQWMLMKKIKDNIILNDSLNNGHPIFRNWFFAATIIIVFANIIAFYINGDYIPRYGIPSWDSFSWQNFWQGFVNSFNHANWQHVLLNMLCFLIAGAYLERKMGSIKLLLFIFFIAMFSAMASAANDLSLNWRGYSGVNYALYGYIIVDYIISIIFKSRRTKLNLIIGAVIIALIYLAMCFCGGTTSVTFAPYPYDLLHNIGHASGFFVGLIIGIAKLVQTFVDYLNSKVKTEQIEYHRD